MANSAEVKIATHQVTQWCIMEKQSRVGRRIFVGGKMVQFIINNIGCSLFLKI